MTQGLIACPSCGAMVPSLLTLRDDQEAAVRRLRRSALLREDDGRFTPALPRRRAGGTRPARSPWTPTTATSSGCNGSLEVLPL